MMKGFLDSEYGGSLSINKDERQEYYWVIVLKRYCNGAD